MAAVFVALLHEQLMISTRHTERLFKKAYHKIQTSSGVCMVAVHRT